MVLITRRSRPVPHVLREPAEHSALDGDKHAHMKRLCLCFRFGTAASRELHASGFAPSRLARANLIR